MRVYLQLQVKALEAADAARRKEAQRAAERAQQRQQLEAQKAERLKRAHDAKVSPDLRHSLLLKQNPKRPALFGAERVNHYDHVLVLSTVLDSKDSRCEAMLR